MLRILVVALVLLVAAMFLLPRTREAALPPEAATLLPETLALPEFALATTDDRAFTTESLATDRGFRLLFFGFTNCPDICPLTLATLAQVREELAARAPNAVPQVVFVSVDPQRDSPQRVADYVRNFDPEFVGVTGSEEALAPLVAALGVSVHRVEVDGEHYNVVHNGTVYVVGPGAEVTAVFGGSVQDPAVIASDYLRIRRRALVGR